MPELMWPMGLTYFSQQYSLPWFPRQPPATCPYRSWGQVEPTQVWANAGKCWPRGAGQSGDQQYLAELAAERATPTEARPYLLRGEWPPMPGSRTYSEVIKPQFVDRLDEQHYIDWWYGHFTTDAPRYTLPALPSGGEAEPPTRPPRDWPAQEPIEEETTTTSITTTGTPTTTTERRTPWGWVIGGGAALLLIGGGVAYALAKPKRRKDGGRRRRRR